MHNERTNEPTNQPTNQPSVAVNNSIDILILHEDWYFAGELEYGPNTSRIHQSMHIFPTQHTQTHTQTHAYMHINKYFEIHTSLVAYGTVLL